MELAFNDEVVNVSIGAYVGCLWHMRLVEGKFIGVGGWGKGRVFCLGIKTYIHSIMSLHPLS